jgi:hypothetical protein
LDFFNHSIQSFEEFCDENAGEGSPILEAYITERGMTVPESDWRKIRTNMRGGKAGTGLDFGNAEEEVLYKYTDQVGQTGQVGRLSIPIDVRIDQTSHAANQIYRWEHRFDQVDQEEILSDIKKAAPTILDLVLSGQLKVGTGWSPRKGTQQNYEGQVWIKNSNTMLNTIVQVKGRESKEYPLKLLVVTVLRKKDFNSLTRRDQMTKIVISDAHETFVVLPRS